MWHTGDINSYVCVCVYFLLRFILFSVWVFVFFFRPKHQCFQMAVFPTAFNSQKLSQYFLGSFISNLGLFVQQSLISKKIVLTIGIHTKLYLTVSQYPKLLSVLKQFLFQRLLLYFWGRLYIWICQPCGHTRAGKIVYANPSV